MIILLQLFCLIAVSRALIDPIVKTNFGKVKGFKYERRDGGKSDVFLGIPFAKPPVGELRFEKPEFPSPWNGVRDALEFGNVCYTHNMSAAIGVVSEDCLTLNVMRPDDVTSESKLPILVWIHGGGYEQGSANIYGYKGFANIYNPDGVIAVSIQYRIGFLGFFSDGEQLLGNFGSWDQTLALQFIKENIGSFGGDPEKITIYGISAGASSTSQLSLSPHSNKFFSQCISLSGSTWAGWSQNDYTIKHSLDLATAVGCHNVTDLKKCLKSKTMDELFAGIEAIGGTHYSLNAFKFTPRIDGDFYPDSVEKMLEVQKPIPTILGVSKRESLFFTLLGRSLALHELNIPPSEFKNFDEEKFITALKELCANEEYFGKDSDTVLDHLVEEYINRDKPITVDYRYYIDRYSKLVDDLWFHVSAVRELVARASRGDEVYAYLTEHFHKTDFPDDFPVRGATHLVEFPYLFERFVLGNFNIEEDVVEQRVAKTFRESFINFTKTGKPTNSISSWEPTDTATLKYLNIGDEPTMREGFLRHELEFWNSTAQKFGFDLVTLLRTTRGAFKDEL